MVLQPLNDDVDQVLLLVSMFLTYVAGVVPTGKVFSDSQKETSDGNMVSEDSMFSGSFMKHDVQVSSHHAWDVVKRKLRDSLNAVECVGILRRRIIEFEQPPLKQPLSLYAIGDALRFWLLWAPFHYLEKEFKNISEGSGTMDRDDWMVIFDGIMQRFSEPVCVAWLEQGLSLERSNCNMAPPSSIFKKLKEENSILKNIKKSGKMDLFADLLALDWWLHQNMDVIAAMYEDHFDLYTLQREVIEDLSETWAEKDSWWKLFTRRKSGKSSPLHYVVIGQISVPTKHTMELRALTGWRYYFSLFLELSDIEMPIIKAVVAKVSSTISYFLVSLIGWFLGLICTGIRQSL